MKNRNDNNSETKQLANLMLKKNNLSCYKKNERPKMATKLYSRLEITLCDNRNNNNGEPNKKNKIRKHASQSQYVGHTGNTMLLATSQKIMHPHNIREYIYKAKGTI